MNFEFRPLEVLKVTNTAELAHNNLLIMDYFGRIYELFIILG